MESPSDSPPPIPTPPPVQPRRVGPAGRPAPVPRIYPKPPAFIPRFIMLCLRPESWVEAARFPSWVTLLPLLAAILLGAAILGAADTTRFLQSLNTFADQYDARGYPPLELHPDATLSVNGALNAPIRVELRGVAFWPDDAMIILVDPTGATTPDSVKTPGYLITGKQVATTGGPEFTFTLAKALSIYQIDLPPAGQTLTINSAALKNMIAEHEPIVIFCGILVAALYAASQSLWALLMLFILSPIIMIAAAGLPSETPRRRLLLPRRAAVRMVAGLLVPIVLVDSILRAAGYGVARVVGIQWNLGVWFVVCFALAIWVGILANRVFLPRSQERRAH